MRPLRLLTALFTIAALTGTACTSTEKKTEPASASGIDSRNGEIPNFSNPTEITNEYLPYAQGGRWIYEGTKEGKPYMIEVAVTNDTKTIEWNGNSTEAVVLRHRGWVDGVIIEEALDYYAQGDDGGVWYFGEDVDNYKKGKLADHEGAWLAGVDGALPALLMPGNPKVGQVFYSEDIVDLEIVERDEILSLGEPAETPEGTVDNGLLLGATEPDGHEEEKVFVPDVGEVLARSDEGEVRLVQRLPDNVETALTEEFSDPATVDNPYFGVTGVDYRLYFGKDEGEPIRIEVSPTGETKTIPWAGGNTETVVSQFLETSRRDLLEFAYDWFAQDDTGNVWYFGEDVFNYDKGRIADNHGSWIAGSDTPPGMIMPADPTLGQRFNPENAPGVVFETVDVQALDATYKMPTGDVLDPVLQLHETLDDGTEELKGYAAGYGNVSVDIPGVETVDLVYALPNDSIASPLPKELQEMKDELLRFSTTGTGSTGHLRSALDAFSGRGDAVPPILVELANKRLDALERAFAGAADAETRLAAFDLEQTVLDIARLYETKRPVDFDLIDLQARTILAAVDAGDRASAATAAAIAAGLAERNTTTLSKAVAQAAAATDAAADETDLGIVAKAASKLRAIMR